MRRMDWSDGNYMEWADQERLVRQDLEEIQKQLKSKEDAHERTCIKGEAKPGNHRTEF